MGWTLCLATSTCLTLLKEAQKNHTFKFHIYGGTVIPKAADRDFYGGDPSAGWWLAANKGRPK